MQDNQQMTSQSLQRFYDQLTEAGMSGESASNYMGRLVAVVTEALGAKMDSVLETLSDEEMERLKLIEDEATKQTEVLTIFRDKVGKSIDEFREEMLNSLVSDFETQ